MTREEKLYSMRGVELIAEAEKHGVKVAHKGNALKESKEKAIQKILAAEAAMMDELNAEAEKVANAEPTLSISMPTESGDNGPQLIEKIEDEHAVEVEAEEEPVDEPKTKKRTRKSSKSKTEFVPEDADAEAVNAIFSIAPLFSSMSTRDYGVAYKIGNRRMIEFYTVENGYTVWIVKSWADVFAEYLPDTRKTHNPSWALTDEWTLTKDELVKFIAEVA